MRPRALATLVSLTTADYLLWHWSLGGSHDVLALASGMTLLPLTTLSAAFLGMKTMAIVARLGRRRRHAGAPRRRDRQSAPAADAQRSSQANPPETPANPPEAPANRPEAPAPSTNRLAA